MKLSPSDDEDEEESFIFDCLFTINLRTLGFYTFALTKLLKRVHKLNIFETINLEKKWRFHTTSKITKEHISLHRSLKLHREVFMSHNLEDN